MKNQEPGWDWFKASPANSNGSVTQQFQECFRTPSGKAVLDHLKRHFLERRLSANASDAELRHFEGARCAIAYIDRLAKPLSLNDREQR